MAKDIQMAIRTGLVGCRIKLGKSRANGSYIYRFIKTGLGKKNLYRFILYLFLVICDVNKLALAK